jgi:hypothetical protein
MAGCNIDFKFRLPDGSCTDVHLYHGVVMDCIACKKKASVLERKITCKGCGGLCCLQCQEQLVVAFKDIKVCKLCTAKIISLDATQYVPETSLAINS